MVADVRSDYDADGDPELGKAKKRSEMEMTCKGEGVPYPVENTLFIDPVEAYTITNKRVPKKENGKTVLNEHGETVYVTEPRMEYDKDGRTVRIPQTVLGYDEDAAEEFRRSMNSFLERITSI